MGPPPRRSVMGRPEYVDRRPSSNGGDRRRSSSSGFHHIHHNGNTVGRLAGLEYEEKVGGMGGGGTGAASRRRRASQEEDELNSNLQALRRNTLLVEADLVPRAGNNSNTRIISNSNTNSNTTNRFNNNSADNGVRCEPLDAVNEAPSTLDILQARHKLLKRWIKTLELAGYVMGNLTQDIVMATSHQKEKQVNERILEIVSDCTKGIGTAKKTLDALKKMRDTSKVGCRGNTVAGGRAVRRRLAAEATSDEEHILLLEEGRRRNDEDDDDDIEDHLGSSDVIVVITPAEHQMCGMILSSCSADFKAKLTFYLQCYEEFKKEMKSKLGRQLEIAYPDAPQETIDKLVQEDPKIAQAAIQKQLQRTGQASDRETELHLQNVLFDLEDKYNDLRRLETGIEQLHQMFLYLAALVDEQSQQLDTIERAVDNTRDYTGEAVIQLQEAKKNKEAADKKKFWCYTILIVVSIAALLLLLWKCGCLG